MKSFVDIIVEEKVFIVISKLIPYKVISISFSSD